MTDERRLPDPNEELEQAKPKQSGRPDAQQRQAGVPDLTVHESQPQAPGRKPLFRS